MTIYFTLQSPLPSNRQHLSSGCCLEDKREDNQNYSVPYCVRHCCAQWYGHTWAVLTFSHVRFRFLLCVIFGFIFCVFFHASLGHFVLVLLAFVVLGLVSSVLSQEIGWEERLRNDLFCVELDVKPWLNQSINPCYGHICSELSFLIRQWAPLVRACLTFWVESYPSDICYFRATTLSPLNFVVNSSQLLSFIQVPSKA